MKTRFSLILMSLFMALGWSARADETITVTANNADISANLDLKAVATLFGQSKNLEEFEQALNSEDSRISNLDLNADGIVDYLRIVETAEGQKHLILIQAVLAKDIFQDVASIYVEKDEVTNEITTQIIGNEYLYGVNYIVEPVYYVNPFIYDWFFYNPHWYCYSSLWYWDYWPYWYHPFHCWAMHDYWHHIYDYHYHHHYCSYRHPAHPAPHYAPMAQNNKNRRGDYATRHPEQSFSSRTANVRGADGRGVSNARQLQPTRNAVAAARTEGSREMAASSSRTAASSNRTAANASSSRVSQVDRTFGSQNTRVAASSARSASSNGSRGTTTAAATRGASASATASATRQAVANGTSRTAVPSVNRSSAAASATLLLIGSIIVIMITLSPHHSASGVITLPVLYLATFSSLTFTLSFSSNSSI